MKEKRQKKEERKRRKAAAKAAGAARAGGEQSEEIARAARPARKSLSDWRGKLSMAGFGADRGGSARSSAGDVSSLVGKEKLVVQQQEAYGDKFYKQVPSRYTVVLFRRVWFVPANIRNACPADP